LIYVLQVLLVIVAFVALVVLLLNINIKIFLHYDDEKQLQCLVKYLFLKKVLIPQSEKSKRKKAKRRIKKGRSPDEVISLSELYDESDGLMGFLKSLAEIVKSIWSLLKAILNNATLKKLDFKMNVASDDAADTAVTYGYANAVVYPIVAAIVENVMSFDDYNVEIKPDFSDDAVPSAEFDLNFNIKLLHLLKALLDNMVATEAILKYTK